MKYYLERFTSLRKARLRFNIYFLGLQARSQISQKNTVLLHQRVKSFKLVTRGYSNKNLQRLFNQVIKLCGTKHIKMRVQVGCVLRTKKGIKPKEYQFWHPSQNSAVELPHQNHQGWTIISTQAQLHSVRRAIRGLDTRSRTGSLLRRGYELYGFLDGSACSREGPQEPHQFARSFQSPKIQQTFLTIS